MSDASTDTIESYSARMVIDLDQGGRIVSWTVDEHELLVSDGPPYATGLFVMAPWAGRTRNASFLYQRRTYHLRPTLDPHALHGSVWYRRWEQVAPGVYQTDLGPDWPFPGFIRHTIVVHPESVEMTLELHADSEPMPGAIGWHPCFCRWLGGEAGPAQVSFSAGGLLAKDPGGVATQRRIPVTSGPWDDCFVEVQYPAAVHWPGTLDLSVISDARFLVVFDQWAHMVALEPQTAPPDSLNSTPHVIEPGVPLVAKAIWAWSRRGNGQRSDQ